MDKIIPLVILVLFCGRGYASAYADTVNVDIGQTGRADNVVREIKLTQVDNMFLPAQINVTEGETVRFTIKNGGNHKHEMLIGSMADLKKAAGMRRTHPDSEHAEANLVQLEPGVRKDLIWQFGGPGVVDFACPLPGHFKKMRGKIIVEKK
ncbi:MAG: hypothetical protein LZF61_07305 [Nitrosomonas sp.]|nr:MAG: hypothetical protein LZF61_07305 [Nitrosomonas sp.]